MSWWILGCVDPQTETHTTICSNSDIGTVPSLTSFHLYLALLSPALCPKVRALIDPVLFLSKSPGARFVAEALMEPLNNKQPTTRRIGADLHPDVGQIFIPQYQIQERTHTI